jgi:phosphoribosylglycinamide formyltransferase-1
VKAGAGKVKLAVFISGGGSNLQAMIDRIGAGELDAEICLVLSSSPEAYGLIRAEKSGFRTAVVNYRIYGRKVLRQIPKTSLPKQFAEVLERQRIFAGLPAEDLEDRLGRLVLAEREIIALLEPLAPDLICLAGFMRLLSPFFIEHYQEDGQYRIMNIHPALLPAFPGGHGYADTFSYGCKLGGVTVHFVDEGEDTGPVIAQAVYPIWPQDTLEATKRRGLQLEHALYPQCIQWFARGHLQVVKSSGGRMRVRIIDPEYPQFVENLVRQAFAR